MFSVWMGCGKDNTTAPQTPAEISAVSIICNPLSPAPGDTAWLTVQPLGEGGVPSYDWEVGGGALLSQKSISVQWVVPEETGVFRVAVKVTLGTATDTLSRYVMVRRCESVNTGIRFSYAPQVAEDFLIIGAQESASTPGFPGYHVYRLGLTVEQVTQNQAPSVDGGYDFTFIGNTLLASVVTNYNSFLRQQSMNVIMFPLAFGTKKYVSNNDQNGTVYRKCQHTSPSATADLKMVAWVGHSIGASEDGTKDLVNIDYRKETGPISILTISKDSTYKYEDWLYRYFRNIHPMFTPDERNILYFNDSTGTYEPCLIPVDPVTGPRVGQNRQIGGPALHGIFFNSSVQVSEKTIFEWNPKIPTQLGFIDMGKNFCILDYEAETVDIVSSVGKIQEFVWSEDGEAAVVTKTGVAVVTPGGTPDTVFVKERTGDDVYGLNWSPAGVGEKGLAFRMVRKGVSTAESFSALVYYSMTAKRWYFASPRIAAANTEPSVDYRWLRAVFDLSGNGIFIPVPVSDDGGKVVIYHSY
jgi:hypothetical protein